MIVKKENNKDVRRFVKLREDIIQPKAATKCSAGYDIFLPEDVFLIQGEEYTVYTGLRYETSNPDEVLMIYPRSGLGFKKFLRLANTVGVVDADYDGEILIKVRNESYLDEPLILKRGDAIAQAVILPFLKLEPDNRDNVDRGVGGFGSTDNK